LSAEWAIFTMAVLSFWQLVPCGNWNVFQLLQEAVDVSLCAWRENQGDKELKQVGGGVGSISMGPRLTFSKKCQVCIHDRFSNVSQTHYCSTRENKTRLYFSLPVPMTERSKARTVFGRSNTGIVGLNPTRGTDVCTRFLCCIVLCVGRGLASENKFWRSLILERRWWLFLSLSLKIRGPSAVDNLPLMSLPGC
jgi:hypothetical protein